MAKIQLTYKSKVLAMQTDVTVIIPELEALLSPGWDGKLKTLYLLHGLSNHHANYTRFTNLETFVEEKKLAVVMPSADHSFYTDMKYGHPYFTYISEELPGFLGNLFPLSSRREDNFVAGHSMGGYGALKLALTYPERFAAAASLSGVMDINYILPKGKLEGFNPESIFGEVTDLTGTKHDLFHLLEQTVAAGKALPELFQICGTEDFLYQDNLRFRDFARRLQVNLTYREEPGDHEWWFWAKVIEQVLDWLPLS